MQVNYNTGSIGPLLTGDEVYTHVPEGEAVMITGHTEEAVRQAAKAVSAAVKKKRRKQAAQSRRANRA